MKDHGAKEPITLKYSKNNSEEACSLKIKHTQKISQKSRTTMKLEFSRQTSMWNRMFTKICNKNVPISVLACKGHHCVMLKQMWDFVWGRMCLTSVDRNC